MTAGIPEPLSYCISALYILCLSGLFLYGTNCYVLLLLFHRNRSKGEKQYQDLLKSFATSPWKSDLPRVTVQLPIYNERYVVGRLIKAVSALDYPRGSQIP